MAGMVFSISQSHLLSVHENIKKWGWCQVKYVPLSLPHKLRSRFSCEEKEFCRISFLNKLFKILILAFIFFFKPQKLKLKLRRLLSQDSKAYTQKENTWERCIFFFAILFIFKINKIIYLSNTCTFISIYAVCLAFTSRMTLEILLEGETKL